MTSVLDDLPALQRQIQSLEAAQARAEGAINELRKQLKAEFGCKSIEQAEALLKKLEREERELVEQYTKAKELFEKKWAKVLGEFHD